MSVPTTLCARSGKTTSSVSPKKTPLPTEVKPTMNPPKAPMRTAATRSRFVSCQLGSRRGRRLDEALRDEPDRAEEQRRAEHLPHHRLGVVAVALGQLHVDPDAEQRHRRRADEHPAREPRADIAHPPVLNRSDRLEHGAVRDVRPDRGRRRDPEEEDQDRRHQRPATHPGHPDEEPGQSPRRELPVTGSLPVPSPARYASISTSRPRAA